MKNWTVNAMESLQKAQAKAYEMGTPNSSRCTCCGPCSAKPGWPPIRCGSLELDPALIAQTAEKELASLPDRRAEGTAWCRS